MYVFEVPVKVSVKIPSAGIFRAQDGGGSSLRNAGSVLQFYTASYPRSHVVYNKWSNFKWFKI
jgi:hypothetical protein